jgi:antibiotic biosynthesis monooxygenase (ABM) superfamily enzyme
MSTSERPSPVTVLITRRVLRGRAAEFNRLMVGMQEAARGFPGHMGGFLIPPEQSEEGCWRILFAFDSEANLQAWTQSGERQRWLQRIAQVTHGDAAVRVMSGLETWFELPSARVKVPPPRWKMALVTLLGIYPLVQISAYALTPALGPLLPPWLAALLATAAITVAMTWLVMPTLVRLLAGFLYPAAREPGAEPPHPPETP